MVLLYSGRTDALTCTQEGLVTPATLQHWPIATVRVFHYLNNVTVTDPVVLL